MLIDHETRREIAAWVLSLAQQATLGQAISHRCAALRNVEDACASFAATGNLGTKVDRPPTFTGADVQAQGEV